MTQSAKAEVDPTPNVSQSKFTIKDLAQMVAASDSLAELNMKMREALDS